MGDLTSILTQVYYYTEHCDVNIGCLPVRMRAKALKRATGETPCKKSMH